MTCAGARAEKPALVIHMLCCCGSTYLRPEGAGHETTTPIRRPWSISNRNRNVGCSGLKTLVAWGMICPVTQTVSLWTHFANPVQTFARAAIQRGAHSELCVTLCGCLSKMEVDVNLTKIWNSTLGTMQVQTSRHEFNTWLRRTSLLGIENGVATIGAPSAFFKEGLENRYITPLRDLISNLAGFPVQVRVVIAPPQMTRPSVTVLSHEHGQDVDEAPLYDEPSGYPGGAANGRNGGGNAYDRLG